MPSVNTFQDKGKLDMAVQNRILEHSGDAFEILFTICEEWERQKHLFPDLAKDGWMEMNIGRANRLLKTVKGGE